MPKPVITCLKSVPAGQSAFASLELWPLEFYLLIMYKGIFLSLPDNTCCDPSPPPPGYGQECTFTQCMQSV